jgi:hypothetical protein
MKSCRFPRLRALGIPESASEENGRTVREFLVERVAPTAGIRSVCHCPLVVTVPWFHPSPGFTRPLVSVQMPPRSPCSSLLKWLA